MNRSALQLEDSLFPFKVDAYDRWHIFAHDIENAASLKGTPVPLTLYLPIVTSVKFLFVISTHFPSEKS